MGLEARLATRVMVSDALNGEVRPFIGNIEVHSSSFGGPWDDTISLEYATIPAAQMDECYVNRYTVIQHLAPGRIERLAGSHQFEALSVDAGVVLLDPPGSLTGARWDTPQDVLFLMPSEALFQRVAMETESGALPDLIRVSAIHDPQIAQLGHLLLREVECGSPSGRLFGESLGLALAARIMSRFSTTPMSYRNYDKGMQRWRLKRTLEYIKSSLGKDLKLGELADTSGLSQYYFCRLFKESMGVSPHKYVMTQRIQRARELLGGTKMSIGSVGEQLGFADQAHFTTAFRKATKMTPRQFRDQA